MFRDKELARAVDVMMAERIYILIIKVNKLFSFFVSLCFLKEIENMYSVFLSSYRNTRESLGELEKLWEHSSTARVPIAFSFSQTSIRRVLFNKSSIETRYMFYISEVFSVEMTPLLGVVIQLLYNSPSYSRILIGSRL